MKHTDYLTYRHPRTLNEAFGCDAVSACAVSHHRFRRVRLVRWLLRAVAFGWCVLAVIGLMS